jgi:hypothetical protein
MARQKLELTWIGKDQRPRLEPRILLEDPARSYHARQRVTDKDIFDNRLIKGDNLLALKALEAEFAGKVKCVFIDPPYNTGSAFTHYDDGLEHSIWLGLMRDRLEIIRRLLAEDGSLWITIDDNEAHYLKVLCDEVFGRSNFVANVVWQKAYAPRSNASLISDSHDHVLVFAKAKPNLKFNLLGRSAEQTAKYKNPDNDPRGPWKPENSSISLLSGQRGKQYAKTGVSAHRHQPRRPRPRFLRRLRHHWRRRPQDGPPLDHGGAGRALPHAHHSAPARRSSTATTPAASLQATGWNGGGGFRYYRLAPSLLQQDRFGQWVINREYNADMLAAAVAKLEGFTYAPSADAYWQHGYSTETDFIYVTTQTLSAEHCRHCLRRSATRAHCWSAAEPSV